MKFAQFERFEIELPDEAVPACSHQGACDADVEHWAKRLPIDVDPALLRAELDEYGAWDDEELSDHDANVRRIIWLAAGRI